ncbi:hypothetical protein GQ457_05G015070 [Hibiscus cannabinus]
MIPKQFRVLGKGAAIVSEGFLTLNLAATVAIGAFRSVAERKRKEFALPCGICKGKVFYLCKLCNRNATIKWSPLYDPIHISHCVCPTCDGNRVQRCLNCLGKGAAIVFGGFLTLNLAATVAIGAFRSVAERKRVL